jgi:hypothetical protein
MDNIINVPTKKQTRKRPVWFVYYFKFIMIAMPLIILAVGFFVIVRPVRKSYIDNQEQIKIIGDAVASKTKRLMEVGKIFSSYKNIGLIDREKMENIIPVGLDDASIFINMESLVGSHELNLSLDDISVNSATDNKSNRKKVKKAQQENADIYPASLNKAKISLSLSQVNYLNLKAFLKAVEVNLLLLDVSEFKFNPVDEKMEISMDTYYFE